MRCRECRSLLELREIPPATAEREGLRVELFGLRGAVCPHPGHPLHPPYPDFPADLAAAVIAGDALPKAIRRGLWRRRLGCGRCGAGLEPSAGAASAGGEGPLRTRVRMEGVAPFTLTVEGAATTCPRCGLRQLAAEDDGRALGEALAGALLDALTEAGLVAGSDGPGPKPRDARAMARQARERER